MRRRPTLQAGPFFGVAYSSASAAEFPAFDGVGVATINRIDGAKAAHAGNAPPASRQHFDALSFISPP
jgi:hypothetical protein